MRSRYRQEMSLSLFVFLKRAKNRYPVYYSDGSRKSRIEWLGEVRCATWTGLDARGDEIVARKACSPELDRRVRGTLIGDFVFNYERTQMGRVSGTEGWHWFELVRAACRRSRAMAAHLRETEGRQSASRWRSSGRCSSLSRGPGLSIYSGRSRAWSRGRRCGSAQCARAHTGSLSAPTRGAGSHHAPMPVGPVCLFALPGHHLLCPVCRAGPCPQDDQDQKAKAGPLRRPLSHTCFR